MYHIVEQKVKQTFKENILKPLQVKFQYFSNPLSLTVYSNIKQLDTVCTKLRLRVSRLGGETFPKSNCTHCGLLEMFEHVFFLTVQFIKIIEHSFKTIF